jgi:phosphoribosylaminoimidazolecarboxamide formyltransferase/IMP cyclohydrolase
MKRVGGGLLLQTADRFNVQEADLRVVTRIAPTSAQIEDLLFAYRVAKFVKSNAIVFCGRGMTLGVGAGQMSRVDSTRIAASKAQQCRPRPRWLMRRFGRLLPLPRWPRRARGRGRESGHPARGLNAGRGSDCSAADEHGLAMVFTGARHFRH